MSTREGSSSYSNWQITRRDFLIALGVVAGSAIVGLSAFAAGAQALQRAETVSNVVPVEFKVNGQPRSLTLDPRVTLLDALRENLGLTGTRKGCDHGQCGACTVLVQGRRINSCLSLAVAHEGDEVLTIEGLAQGEALHPVQSAFVQYDGFQCGFCTAGQICSAVGLLDEVKRGAASVVTHDLRRAGPVELTPAEVRERMSGNICRCGAYPGIVQAVLHAHRVGAQE